MQSGGYAAPYHTAYPNTYGQHPYYTPYTHASQLQSNTYNYPNYNATQPPPFIPYEPTPSQPVQPVPGPSTRSHNNRSISTPAIHPTPLKSALKRFAAATQTPAPPPLLNPELETQRRRHHRSRTQPPDPPILDPPTPAPLARQRTVSNPRRPQPQPLYQYQSIHLFLSFRGTNELLFESIPDNGRDEIRQFLRSQWEGGIELEERRDLAWRVKFKHHPWDASGVYVTEAWNLIIELFTLFCRRGYAFQTLINIGCPHPRYVFITQACDDKSTFFLAYFSKRGHKVMLIKPPIDVRRNMQATLRAFLPEETELLHDDRPRDDNLMSLQMKRNSVGMGSIKRSWSPGQGITDTAPTFVFFVLKALNDLGYHLETTLMMARPLSVRGLGFGTKMELLIFKGAAKYLGG